jgi:tetratricopeptide (TPR) repeat protein
VLKRLQRFDQALAAYEAVLALDPNDVDALNECGGLLMWLDRPAEAVACYERALAAARGIAELHINKGTALVALNRHQDALESFAAATAIDPERAEAHYNQSLVHLRLGAFRSGWRRYEWRWKKFGDARSRRCDLAPSRSRTRPFCCLPSRASGIRFTSCAMRRLWPHWEPG